MDPYHSVHNHIPGRRNGEHVGVFRRVAQQGHADYHEHLYGEPIRGGPLGDSGAAAANHAHGRHRDIPFWPGNVQDKHRRRGKDINTVLMELEFYNIFIA